MTNPADSRPYADDDAIDFAELFARMRRGLTVTLGLTFLGLALGLGIALLAANKRPVESTLRVYHEVIDAR